MIDLDNLVVVDYPGLIFWLRITFLYFVLREFWQTSFYQSKNKLIWFVVVAVFGVWGYCYFLAHRRKLVVKRTFNPDFRIVRYRE